jgi:hypothetical protein
MKWQAAPGVLFCKKEFYDPNANSRIVLPGSKGKEAVYRIASIGPGVEGYKEGDLITYEKGTECVLGVFVRVQSVLGRFVPDSAPNSAIGVPPANGSGIDVEALKRDMAAAD